MTNGELADRLNDAWAVLRGVSTAKAEDSLMRQGIQPHGPLDGSLLDDVLEGARRLRAAPEGV